MVGKPIIIGLVTAVFGLAACWAVAADDKPEVKPRKEEPAADEGIGPVPPPRMEDAELSPGEEWGPPPGGPKRHMPPEGQPRMPGRGPGRHEGDSRDIAPPAMGRPSFDGIFRRERDPEMTKLDQQEWDLERQTRALAREFGQADASQRAEVKEKLASLVAQQFDVRQKRRELQLKRLEADIQRLRDAIDRRNQARKQIVEKRVSQLLGPDEDVEF